MGKYEKKRIHDVVLGLALLIVALALFVIDITKASNDNGNKTVVVSIDGKKEAEYPLNKDGTHILHGSHLGTNKLVIKDGEAYIEEASCPDKQCVRQGKISKAGEMLVCLPNRVVVKIIHANEEEPVIDGVSG
ncbi:MAG: NusG domain II-containing protein [Lachnospiraceae bacterium]|nr:NusG domain II-containing protein [Lachnospiraceae bacterium]